MQSTAKTSCRQLADKLRQPCDSLATSPGKAIASGKQHDRETLTNGGQSPDKLEKFPKNCHPSKTGFMRLTPPSFPPCRARGVETVAMRKKGVLIFLLLTFLRCLLDQGQRARILHNAPGPNIGHCEPSSPQTRQPQDNAATP